MTKKTNKALAVLMALIMVISLLPVSALASYDTGSLSVKTKGADAVTSVPDLDPGEVWTDKSVSYTSAADDLFQIQLSALGQNFSGLTPGSTTLANVVLVLDISGSTQDDNKLDNMVSAVNTAVSSILAANPANQVGVVTFSTGSDTLVTLRSTSFDLTTDWDDQDSDTFYVYGNGGTNIQSGINRGYDLLEAANDTATPIMIVLSDGVACYYNASYASIPTGSYGNSGWQQDGNGYLNVSDGVSTNQGITAAAYTIVQAMYLKDQMPELQIYTIGYGTGANKLANATLNPTPGNIALVTGAGSSPITLTSQLTATGYSAPAGYFYPEVGGTFSGTSVDIPTLIATFNSIINASLNNFSPLASGQPVTFTEAIGAGFEVSGSLAMVLKSGTYTFTDADGDGTYTCTTTAPAGVSVTVSGTTAKTLTWVIPESELPCNYYTLDDEDNPVSHVVTPASLTFNVALKSGAVADTMYFTNYDSAAAYAAGATSPGAHATFKPSATNPSYYDAVPGTTPTYPDNSDWEVEVRRTETQDNRTYTVTGLENDGTSYTGIIAGYNVV
ncbi:MAG TPA: vWA domain-containing protein, partial [Oscillospiraceae bacterium]|nr:vWA domain-containing protein [Oscillospiraceae bacterium]